MVHGSHGQDSHRSDTPRDEKVDHGLMEILEARSGRLVPF